VTDEEIILARETRLFQNMSDSALRTILQSAQLLRVPANTLIVREGELADSFFIIIEGSVRVFTYDSEHNMIALARLNKNNYFGEQGIIGENTKTRNANVETIHNTLLLKIRAESIIPLWKENKKLIKHLREVSYQQAMDSLKLSTTVYNDIISILKNETSARRAVIHCADGELIFRCNDQPDNVYIILKGRVELLFPVENGKQEKIILNEGQLFGELGVIEKKPRLATAITNGNVRLLSIHGDCFNEVYKKNDNLKKLLNSLKQIYQLPRIGSVEQYTGNTKKTGPTITTIYRMDSGKIIIAARSVLFNAFTMTVSNADNPVYYRFFQNDNNYTQLAVSDGCLVGIESLGMWDDLNIACQMMLKNEKVDLDILKNFPTTRSFSREKMQAEIICNCMSVTKSKLQECIDRGLRTLESLSKETGACSVCCSCTQKILKLLGEDIWHDAILKKEKMHSDDICSFLIETTSGQTKPFLPGQYIIVQVKVRDQWIERPYTISDFSGKNNFRITIRRKKSGLLTAWLFGELSCDIPIKISDPQGKFVLNTDESAPILCFAGGIGITPFITYAKFLKKNNPSKKMHILYSASDKKNFVFSDEFSLLEQTLPSFTVSYDETKISDEKIMGLVDSFSNPDIYICGPEGYCKNILAALKKNQYSQNKIHLEEFVHAGLPSQN